MTDPSAVFDSDSEDDAPISVSKGSQGEDVLSTSQPSISQLEGEEATQTQTKKLMDDIFGGSDDESDDDMKGASSAGGGTGTEAGGGDKWSRINSVQQIPAAKSDDIFASDSEDEQELSTNKRFSKGKDKSSKNEGKKRKREEKGSRRSRKEKNRSRHKSSSSDDRKSKGGTGYESGDSYDSGDEVKETKEDRVSHI